MKQNLPEAKSVTGAAVIVILALLGFDSGCAKRARSYSVESRPEAAYLKASTRINLNTAQAEELERLPGIGKVMAERIIEHRIEHGPFRRIEHIMMVRGISERKFQAIEFLITVEQVP